MNEGNDPVATRTKAHSPQALAPRPSAAEEPSRTREMGAPPAFSEGLDRSHGLRMRGFYVFGIAVSVVVILATFGLEGDPLARHLFQAGMAWFGLANATILWMARSSRPIDARVTSAHFALAGVGLLPALYYFGPFSAVTLAFPLALMFVALDRDRLTANVVLAVALAEHTIVAVPIIVGWTRDVGLASIATSNRAELVIVEALVLALIASGHALGRFARRTSAAALDELASARRMIGDQKQVITEAQDRVEQVNRMTAGRWTGQTVGRWRIGTVLGRGAMGEVYEANDRDGREAAVKFLAPGAEASASLVDRFQREVTVAARLESPHIVRVLEVSTATTSVPYLAMERLRGQDLAARLRVETRMPLNAVVAMLDQVARGLEVAHNAGVVHRDLKPHNLFLHDERCWKILDFGVAKVFGIEGTLTQHAMVGTPQYMAPEQVMGEEVTHLSDIYALGAIAYRCLTGRVPHGAKDLSALIYQVVHGSPIRPSSLAGVSRDVENVLAVAMAKDPRRRFTSASEFVAQLASAAAGRTTMLDPPADAWT